MCQDNTFGRLIFLYMYVGGGEGHTQFYSERILGASIVGFTTKFKYSFELLFILLSESAETILAPQARGLGLIPKEGTMGV